MKKDSAYTHIFKYTGLFGGVQVLNILISLVRNKVIAELLGPVGLGLISIYNSTTSLIQNATNFGLQTSGVREISRACNENDDEKIEHYVCLLRSLAIIAAVFGMIVCLLFSNVISYWAFSSSEHTVHIMLLAPVIAMATIAACETAILKATRRLKQMANISVWGMFFALIVSVPIFIKWSYAGIIPSIIIIGVVQLLLTIAFSYRYHPPRFSFATEHLKKGRAMVSIGAAFVVAGCLTSGGEFFVRAYFSEMSVSLAGLYNAGYMITMTYAGMVFAAMETDYYPHLSAVCNDVKKMNGAANRQIEVSLIIIAPLLVALLFGLKTLIPLLFSEKFLPILTMTQIAVMAMFFRTAHLPIAYIVLAKGHSRSFMLIEGVGVAVMVFSMIFCFNNWGLDGTGFALAVSECIYCLVVTSFCCYKYDFEISAKLLHRFFLHFAIALIALLCVLYVDGVTYWLVGVLLVAASSYASYYMFKHMQYDAK